MSENIVHSDRDHIDRKTPIGKRFLTVQMLKIGEYELRLLRVKESLIPELVKVGASKQTIVDKKVVDKVLVVPITIFDEENAP